MLRSFLIATGLVLSLSVVSPAFADHGRLAQNQSDAGKGQVPLADIVRQLQSSQGGEPASIKFRNGTYRILWRDRDGNLQRFKADARTGRTRREK